MTPPPHCNSYIKSENPEFDADTKYVAMLLREYSMYVCSIPQRFFRKDGWQYEQNIRIFPNVRKIAERT